MSKQLPSRRDAGWLLFSALLAISLVAGFARIVYGQAQGAPAAQEEPRQRPRRVGDNSSAQPKPTPDARPAAGQNAPVEVGDDEVLRVDTQLVPVPVVVRDRAGRPVANLRAENFTVFEDGRPQRVTNFATTDAPFEIALLLDTSGSTREDIGLIRRAANLFIEQLRPGDRVSIVSFNTKQEGASKLASVEVKTPLTEDRERLRDALDKLGSSGGTPFYDALERVALEVFREPPREEVRGRRALVALTDGVDSTSEAEFDESRARLRKSGVISYFIQVNTEDFVEERLLRDCRDDGRLSLSKVQLQRYRRIYAAGADAADYANFCQMGQFERMDISRRLYQLARSEMQQLAKDSGGKAFNALDLRDARRAFAEVAEEIGKLYSLGYYSTNKARDGSFRQIRVEVRGVPGAQVTAREGYQAPKG
ncbi:MAG TPA: VWA domain-containing protein [Pyrinomonadaceae bacterium]|jgi:VWFA-related protein|nr:VWA domain-containing protein [Pyrinomonadaceae bacterium]